MGTLAISQTSVPAVGSFAHGRNNGIVDHNHLTHCGPDLDADSSDWFIWHFAVLREHVCSDRNANCSLGASTWCGAGHCLMVIQIGMIGPDNRTRHWRDLARQS